VNSSAWRNCHTDWIMYQRNSANECCSASICRWQWNRYAVPPASADGSGTRQSRVYDLVSIPHVTIHRSLMTEHSASTRLCESVPSQCQPCKSIRDPVPLGCQTAYIGCSAGCGSLAYLKFLLLSCHFGCSVRCSACGRMFRSFRSSGRARIFRPS
jgi:hypothetical protein